MKILIINDGRKGSVAIAKSVAKQISKAQIKESIVEFKNSTKDLPNFILLKLILSFGPRAIAKINTMPFRKNEKVVIISTSRKSAVIAVWLKLKFFDESVIIQFLKPQLPVKYFNIIFLPQHDKKIIIDNKKIHRFFLTPSLFDFEKIKEKSDNTKDNSEKLMVVLGGKNGRGINRKNISPKNITDIITLTKKWQAQKKKREIFFLTSRRTTDNIENIIASKTANMKNVKLCFSNETSTEMFQKLFSVADSFLITPDSFSMISEAVFSNKPVFIFNKKGMSRKKHMRFVNSVILKKIAFSSDELTSTINRLSKKIDAFTLLQTEIKDIIGLIEEANKRMTDDIKEKCLYAKEKIFDKFVFSIIDFILIIPIILIRIFRILKGKETLKMSLQKLTLVKVKTHRGKLIWFHGASIGEITSVLPLVYKILNESNLNVLLTSGTLSSANVIKKKIQNDDFDGRLIYQPAPVEIPICIRRFLKCWRPITCFRIDSDFWPISLKIIEKFNLKHILINGRISEKSANIYNKIPAIKKVINSSLSHCFMKSEKDLNFMKKLGCENLKVLPNLKYTELKTDIKNIGKIELLKKSFGDKKVWHGAVVSNQEIGLIREAHSILKSQKNDILTVISPRKIEAIKNYDWDEETTAFFSKGQIPNKKTQFFINDTFGNVDLFYKSIPTTFIGRSFEEKNNKAGSNPIPAIREGCFIFVGYNYYNFTDVFDELIKYKILKVLPNFNHSQHIAESVGFFLSMKYTDKIKWNERAKQFRIDKMNTLDITLKEIIKIKGLG